MLGRVLERLLDAQAGWAKPLGDWAHGLAAAIFGRMLPIRDFLAGTWLGHPLHALLTDVPIGALTLVIVLDVLGEPAAADVALLIGVLSMLAAALAGFADYSTTDGRARVRATIHSALMVIALVIYLVSLGIRVSGPTNRILPVVLSVVAYLILAGGAFVGGDVVYALGNVVDRHAWRPSSAKWQPLEVGEIAEGTLVKAKLGAQALVLVRSGDTILALHDQCAHAAVRSAKAPSWMVASNAPGTARVSSSRPAIGGAGRRSTISRVTRSGSPRAAVTRRGASPRRATPVAPVHLLAQRRPRG